MKTTYTRGWTPGPWEIHETTRGIEVGTQHEGGSHWIVCDIAAPKSAVAMPNARLIASAPDMAAEIERLRAVNAELLAALQAVVKKFGDYHAPVAPEITQALVAISRAAK